MAPDVFLALATVALAVPSTGNVRLDTVTTVEPRGASTGLSHGGVYASNSPSPPSTPTPSGM